LSLLNTMTVVGTGVLNFIFGNSRVNTSRNCSSFSPTFLMSFSPAFPSMKKFLVRTLTHVSFASTVVCWETRMRRLRLTVRVKIECFITKFLWAKDGGLGESKAVFQCHPLS